MREPNTSSDPHECCHPDSVSLSIGRAGLIEPPVAVFSAQNSPAYRWLTIVLRGRHFRRKLSDEEPETSGYLLNKLWGLSHSGKLGSQRPPVASMINATNTQVNPFRTYLDLTQ